MQRGVFALLFAGLLQACASMPFPEEATVRFDGEWIAYDGPLSEEGGRQLLDLMAAHPDVGLKINSGGGSITVGMDIAQWILVRGLAVYVDQYCYSSCANYIFIAGRQRRLSPDAVIGWHGGTRQWQSAEAMCQKFADSDGVGSSAHKTCMAFAHRERAREEQFFELAGVDQRITTLGFTEGAGYPPRSTDFAWTYTLEDMARLGLDNIHVDGNATWVPQNPDHYGTLCRYALDQNRCIPIE